MKKLIFLLTSCVAFGGTITGFGSFSADNFYDDYANFCLFGLLALILWGKLRGKI